MTQHDQAAYWQSISDEWNASGESQKRFCQRKGISYGQFVTWRSKILSSQGKSRKQLQPVRITPAQQPAPLKLSNPPSTNDVVIHLSLPNGIKIGITRAAPDSTITDLLNQLGLGL